MPMTKNSHLIWALVVAAALLPSDYAHSGVGSLARTAGPRGIPSKAEVKVNAAKGNGRPAHTLALRGGKGYGEGKGTGPAVGLAGAPGVVLKRKASQKLAPKGDKKLLKQTWGVSDSHSPSGLSPRNWGGGSLEIECGDAEVSSISGSTSDCQSLGSGGLSKHKVESDEDAEATPKQLRPIPRFQGGDMLNKNTKVRKPPPWPRLRGIKAAGSCGAGAHAGNSEESRETEPRTYSIARPLRPPPSSVAPDPPSSPGYRYAGQWGVWYRLLVAAGGGEHVLGRQGAARWVQVHSGVVG